MEMTGPAAGNNPCYLGKQNKTWRNDIQQTGSEKKVEFPNILTRPAN